MIRVLMVLDEQNDVRYFTETASFTHLDKFLTDMVMKQLGNEFTIQILSFEDLKNEWIWVGNDYVKEMRLRDYDTLIGLGFSFEKQTAIQVEEHKRAFNRLWEISQ